MCAMLRDFKYRFIKSGVIAIYNGCLGKGCDIAIALERAVKGYERNRILPRGLEK